MAWAEVGSGSQRVTGRVSTGNLDIAFPANVTAGNLLVVGGACQTTEVATVDKTTGSNAFTVVMGPDEPGANLRPFIAYRLATASEAFTVRITTGSNSYRSAAIDEFSGAHATVADATDFGTGTSTTPSDSLTTVAADALIIGIVVPNWQGPVTSITPGASYTEIGEEEDELNWAPYNMVFRIVTTAQAYTVDWTTDPSNPWSVLTHSFAPGTGAPAVPVPHGDQVLRPFNMDRGRR